MKKLFTLFAIGSVALVSAHQYNQSYENASDDYSSCNNNGGYYQDQPNRGHYHQQNQRQNSEEYYQREDRNRQRNNQYDYQHQGKQSYNRNPQRNHDTSYLEDNRRTISDQEINQQIKDTLSAGWFSKGFKNISFDVNNGNVKLRGSVDTLENKNKIEESVRKIDGVREVQNQITVGKENSGAYSESQLQNSEKKYPQDVAANAQDRQLNAKIRDKLNGWFSKSYETLVLKTSNGVVIINGTVDKLEDIQKINEQVKNIEGVRSVNNQLTVKNR